MNKYWFTSKKYRYGFVPITWEGWIITTVFLILICSAAYINGIFSKASTLYNTMHFLFESLCFIIAFVLIVRRYVDRDFREH